MFSAVFCIFLHNFLFHACFSYNYAHSSLYHRSFDSPMKFSQIFPSEICHSCRPKSKLPLSNGSGNFRFFRTVRSSRSSPVLFSFFHYAVFFLFPLCSPDSHSSSLFASIYCAQQVQTIPQSQQGSHNQAVSFSVPPSVNAPILRQPAFRTATAL